MVEFVFKNLERHRDGRTFRQADNLTRSMRIHNGITIPAWSSKLCYAINIYSLNGGSECARGGVMDARLLLYLAPPCALAVEDANHSRTLVCIPDLEQAAMVLDISSLKEGTKNKKEIWTRSRITNLVPSLAGSTNRQSTVGRPGSCARRTDPSGRTSFFKSSKLWLPGLSLHRRTMMRYHETKFKP